MQEEKLPAGLPVAERKACRGVTRTAKKVP